MSVVDVLTTGKAAADKLWRFDDHLPALEAYVSTLRNPAVVAVATPALLTGIANASEKWTTSLVLASVALLFDPANEAANAHLVKCESIAAEKNIGILDAAFQGLVEVAPTELLTTIPEVAGSVASNLSLCLSTLRLWPQALIACLAASVLNPALKEKNVSRYLVAAEQLGKPVAHSQPVDPAVAALLTTIRTERSGVFDFAAFATGDKTPTAEFFDKLVVKDSSGMGLGLFADRDYKAGETVLCEHAVGHATLGESENNDAALKRLIRANNLPYTGFQLTRISATYNGTSRDSESHHLDFRDVLGTPRHRALVFDTGIPGYSEDHLRGALVCNAYAGAHFCERARSDRSSVGLYPAIAFVNHAPHEANVCLQTLGLFAVMRTITPIAKGGELLGSYVGSGSYLLEDQPLSRWGITLQRHHHVATLREIDDGFGASMQKLSKFGTGAELLPNVEPQVKRAFIVNASLFAAMAQIENHPSQTLLWEMLESKTPDLSMLEQCAKITRSQGNKMPKSFVKRMREALAAWCVVALGHANLDAVAAKR